MIMSIFTYSYAENCKSSITKVKGIFAPKKVCAGKLILNESFNTLNKKLWQPEINLSGGGVSILRVIFISQFEFFLSILLFFRFCFDSYRTMNFNGIPLTMRIVSPKMVNCI